MTAAHCFQDKDEPEARPATDIIFFVGKSDLGSITERGFQRLPISEVKFHPFWDPQLSTYEGDIAIAILKRTITFSEKIKPICLPSPGDSIENVKGTVAGWGYDERKTIGGQLKLTRLSVISNSKCVEDDKLFSQLLNSKSFCTELSNRSPCEGISFTYCQSVETLT